MNKLGVIFILLLAAALRFTTLPNLMVFTPDEEYQLYIVQTLIKDFHIIWIGLSALGFDLYMGPFWLYIIYPFAVILHGDPLVLGVLTGILGVATTFLIYFLGAKMFGKKVGLFASLMYATSALMVYYDQQGYPPAVPFFSILMTLSLYMTKQSGKWWILFAATYGMIFHIHFSLGLVIFVAIYWAISHKKTLNKKIILYSALTFLLMVSPLIAFDFFHKASNITAPLRMIQAAQKNKSNLNITHRFSVLAKTFSRVWYLEPHKNSADEILWPCMVNSMSTTTRANKAITVFTLMLLTIFLIRKNIWSDERKRLLILISLTLFIPFLFLSAINPIEYYFLGFFPLLFLISVFVIESFKKSIRYIAYVLIMIFVIHGVFTVFTARNDFGVAAKKNLVTKVMIAIGDAPYELKEEGGCQKYGGWRYIFAVFGRIPERSSEDSVFGWLYPGEISQKRARYQVIMNETRVPRKKTDSEYLLQEGGFSAIIIKHEKD